MTKKKRKVNTKRIVIVALIPVVCIALLIANFTSIRLSIKGYHKEDKKVVLKLEKEDIKDILQYDQIIDIWENTDGQNLFEIEKIPNVWLPDAVGVE